MGFMDELKKLARPYAEDEDDFEDEFDLEDLLSDLLQVRIRRGRQTSLLLCQTYTLRMLSAR